jgi:hypothetical protein
MLSERVVREIEFSVPRHCDLSSAGELIERVCSDRGLHVAMKGSLSSYPGSIHWHFKNKKERGTLELTLHLPQRRIWAQVQDGRKAPWIDVELGPLQRAVERELRSLCSAARSQRGGKGTLRRGAANS